MKKQKMTADNVEQLMEIVRSLQRGEDPAEAALKRETERVPEADAPMAYLQEEEKASSDREDTEEEPPVEKKRPESRGKKSRKKQAGLSQAEADRRIRNMEEEKPEQNGEDWDEDDEFEEFLREDNSELFGGAVSGEKISGALGAARGFLKRLRDEAEENRRRKKIEKQEAEKRKEAAEADVSAEAGSPEDLSEEEKGERRPPAHPAAEEAPSAKEPEKRAPLLSGVGNRRSDPLDDAEIRKTERSLLRRRILLRDEEDELEEEARPAAKEAPPAEEANVFERIAGAREEPDGMEEPPRDSKADGSNPVGADESRERESKGADGPGFSVRADSSARDDSEDTEHSAPAADSLKDAEKPAHEAEDLDHTISRKQKSASLRPNPWSGKIDLHSVKEYISDLFEELRQRGISRREWIMLGAGAVFAVLLIALIFNGITGSMAKKEKSKNVIADEGLTVLVEEEPQEWRGSYPVRLFFGVSGAEIQRIQVNGTAYTADDKGMVTVMADDWLLEAVVETSQGTKNARIEIPWLDGDAPVVNASLSEDRIVLTAADARSTVKKIYYAQVEQGAFFNLPCYQEYKEPIPYAEGTTYYFYAEDEAGNRSVPVITTMERAESLTLRQESMSLFPGETGELMAQARPEGALLTNLKYESMNPEILSVDSTGRVTALSEGTGTVKVSADKVDSVICTVEVSSTRTVTISALGDCTLGTDENFNTDTNFDAFYAVNGSSYFFANVRSILEEDDATFANLEGTFTTSTAREVKEYAFKGDPSYTEILRSGSVDVVTLANNHSSDYGSQSLTDTQNALAEAGIDYCMGDTIVVKEVNGIRTGFIGIYVLNDGLARESQVRETIAAAKAQGAQLVIVAFHWGEERVTQPDETQRTLAHLAIDCGADLVVGHHPHVLQGVEKYNGKYIAYSLANFCFGGNSNPTDMTTMIFQQTFSVTKSGVSADSEAKVIPCSVSSTAGYNNYQPTPLTGEEAASVISRLNEYSASYGVVISDSGTIEEAS